MVSWFKLAAYPDPGPVAQRGCHAAGAWLEHPI